MGWRPLFGYTEISWFSDCIAATRILSTTGSPAGVRNPETRDQRFQRIFEPAGKARAGFLFVRSMEWSSISRKPGA